MQTKDEEIFGMFRRINAMTRMQPRHKDGMTPPSHIHPGEMPSQPPPHEHGKGRMMRLLADEGEMIQSQLAARLEIRPQSLSELLAKAENDGLVTRRQSEEDKRQTIVSLTDVGRERVTEFRSAHKKHAEEFLSPLSEEEKETLSAILSKMIESRNDITEQKED